jgi:hypothetical protein
MRECPFWTGRQFIDAICAILARLKRKKCLWVSPDIGNTVHIMRIPRKSAHMKKAIRLTIITVTLLSLALMRKAHAVSPAPDGGYPGGNTAEGQNALFSLTTGGFNTAVGFLSLRSDTSGGYNTGVGVGALLANTADENTATGAGALLSNSTGIDNTANGAFALFGNATGTFNTAIGVQALLSNTAGSDNTATGVDSLFNNTTGGGNTANGNNALASNTTGNNNTASGFDALDFNTTGNDNIALGRGAGSNQTTGSSNIFIGDVGGAGTNNVIGIGNSPVSGTSYNKCYIGAIYGVTTDSTTTLPVIIDNFGQLGTAPSAARFKKEIKSMDKASESVLALKPVTFQYKSDRTNTPQFGLVAEDVAAVNPDLVVRDKNGEVYTVRYDQVNAMLLNEFLKEHKKVEEQQATIAELKSAVAQQQKGFESKLAQQEEQIERLTAGLQKVSAQLELSKTAPQTVLNNQ